MGTGNRQVHPPAIIYLVDDEESIRGYVTKILESEAYEIYSADSGHSALAGIQALYEAGRAVDVILLDIAMPVVDGFEVLVELRARYQSDPPQVIMLSGKTATTEKVFAFNAGAADYIQKPFHPTELLARIANQVALRQTRQQLIRSEQMTTAIIEALAEGVFVKGEDGRYLLANQAYLSQLGMSNSAELIGKMDRDVASAVEAEAITFAESTLWTGEKSTVQSMDSAVDQRGTEQWWRTDRSLLRGHNGQIFGIVGVQRDVSELMNAQEAHRSALAQAARSALGLQEFTYIASHDLKEPVRKIQAFGERLASRNSGTLDDRSQDYLQRMLNAATRMQDILDALLDYSRITTRQEPLRLTDLNELVAAVVENMSTRFIACKATVEIAPLPTLAVDAHQLSQLFTQLLDNALKFRKPDVPLAVTITSAPAAPDPATNRDRWTILVADNGIGFNAKFADQIFSVFQRLHGRGAYPGSGIGLAICRKIAVRHEGTLIAHSEENQGATFVLTLPVLPAAPSLTSTESADPTE